MVYLISAHKQMLLHYKLENSLERTTNINEHKQMPLHYKLENPLDRYAC